jgi:hypothetical protein
MLVAGEGALQNAMAGSKARKLPKNQGESDLIQPNPGFEKDCFLGVVVRSQKALRDA